MPVKFSVNPKKDPCNLEADPKYYAFAKSAARSDTNAIARNINSMSTVSSVDTAAVLDRATRVELHDGYIRFVGIKLQSDGSEVEGNLDLSLTAENAQLKARIFAVDIPGVDLNNRCVVESNEALEYAFTHMLDYTPGEVLFKEVVVEEGVFRMKMQVNIN